MNSVHLQPQPPVPQIQDLGALDPYFQNLPTTYKNYAVYELVQSFVDSKCIPIVDSTIKDWLDPNSLTQEEVDTKSKELENWLKENIFSVNEAFSTLKQHVIDLSLLRIESLPEALVKLFSENGICLSVFITF